MSEYTKLFERAGARYEPPDLPLEGLLKRHDRNRRNQRIAAGVVGIAVFVVAVWALTGLPSDRTRTPVAPGGTGTGSTVTGPSETGSSANLPEQASLVHGGEVFGVYLAAAPFGSPELDAAIEQLASFGIEGGPTDIGCDQGATEALGVASDVAVVALYFDRRQDAQAWVEALDPPPLGIARVQTLCLD